MKAICKLAEQQPKSKKPLKLAEQFTETYKQCNFASETQPIPGAVQIGYW